MTGLSATTDSVEIFDPSTETFTLATPMMQGRQQHTATLLSSLKVLVAGGADVATGSDFKSAELFQPPSFLPLTVTAFDQVMTYGGTVPTLTYTSESPRSIRRRPARRPPQHQPGRNVSDHLLRRRQGWVRGHVRPRHADRESGTPHDHCQGRDQDVRDDLGVGAGRGSTQGRISPLTA